MLKFSQLFSQHQKLRHFLNKLIKNRIQDPTLGKFWLLAWPHKMRCRQKKKKLVTAFAPPPPFKYGSTNAGVGPLATLFLN